jgi:hypothetical protein
MFAKNKQGETAPKTMTEEGHIAKRDSIIMGKYMREIAFPMDLA